MAGEARIGQTKRWRKRYSAERGLPFDGDDLESQIVWIWGSPRSGSTWLLRQLSFPLALDNTEPLGFRPPADAGARLAAIPFDEFFVAHHIAPSTGPPVSVGDRLLPTTTNIYRSGSPAYVFSDEFADIWRPELRRLTLVRLAAAADRARKAGFNVDRNASLLIKEVNATHAADIVMGLFPRSKMVFLVRDGRDVIDSWADAVGPGGWLAQGGAAYENSEQRLQWVRRSCTTWASMIDIATSAYEQHPPELRTKLRYEDLRADPEHHLGELRRRLGLDSEPELITRIVERHAFEKIPVERRGKGQAVRAARPGGWRDGLSQDEQKAAEEIMGSRLKQFGYED